MKQEQLQSMQKARLATRQSRLALSSPEGFSIVEVLLASSLLVLLVTGLVGAYLYGEESTALAGNRARANMLAEEGLEAVRNIRDAGFASITDGTYGLATTGNHWSLSGSQDVSDIFTRWIVISSIDANRKNVTSNITWQQDPSRTGTVSLATRLTNWITKGDWTIPTEPAHIDLAGSNDGIKIQIVGNYAYLILAAGSPNFFVFNVTNPASPTQVGSFTVSGTPQNIFVSGNYAYVVSNQILNHGLQIINITNPAVPSLADNYSASLTQNATSVYVVGNTAYLGMASDILYKEFLILNVTNPANPTSLGSLDLGASANEIAVSGSYAYVATTDTAQELKVINISNSSAPAQVGFLNLPTSVSATSLIISGTTLFIAQTTTLYVVNVAAPTAPVVLGSLVVGGNINDIALNLGNNNTFIFLATQDTANEFKVIDVGNLATPVLRGQFNIAGSNPLLGVAYSPTLDRAFGAGSSNTEEFAVFAPQ